jgi:hypothetical protein
MIGFVGPVPDEDEIAAIALAIFYLQATQPVAPVKARQVALDDGDDFGANGVR